MDETGAVRQWCTGVRPKRCQQFQKSQLASSRLTPATLRGQQGNRTRDRPENDWQHLLRNISDPESSVFNFEAGTCAEL